MSTLNLLLLVWLGVFIFRRVGILRAGRPGFGGTLFRRKEMTHYEKLRSVEVGPYAKKRD